MILAFEGNNMEFLIEFLKESKDWVKDIKNVVYEMSKTAKYLADDIEHNRNIPIVIVDFSELHRYLYPLKIGQYEETIGIWKDPNKHKLIIDIFFDQSKYMKVLIPDYVDEFRQNLDTMIDTTLFNLGMEESVYAGERIDVEGIVSRIRNEFKQLAEIAEEREGFQDKSERLLSILRHVDENVSRLTHMQTSLQIHTTALNIFEKLRKDKALLNLEEIKQCVPKDFKIRWFDPVYLSVLEFFHKRRPTKYSQNKADAKAVATQIELQKAIGKGRSVVLFSDSLVMRDLDSNSKNVLQKEEFINNLRIHGSIYFAHAFSWLGRTGVSKKAEVKKNLDYFQSWSKIDKQFSSIQADLALLEKELQQDTSKIAEYWNHVNEEAKRAIEYIKEINRQIKLLKEAGGLEAEIATRSSDMWKQFESAKLSNRFRDDIDSIRKTLEEVKELVKGEDKGMVAQYVELSKALARKIDEAAGQVKVLVDRVQGITG